ncbi:cation-translocating P-type ATPase [Legionella sp. km772]|uniref:heavy metal translocating P-type ATPase n=1 Tax=Legionella sp. km772 TaxID=2498111 RepID=UPI000F8D8A29|nr:HAD-IC family P-type ATPase [Legionella sp. km772]RUR13661.1 cation-translocating P-type ATPase [Legionella sp. km772]
MSKPYVFYVDGMSCISCSNTIENSVRKSSKQTIEYFHVDLTTADPKKTTIILTEDNESPELIWEQLKNHIDDVGFTCRDAKYQPPVQQKKLSEKKTTLLDSFKHFVSSHWFLGIMGSTAGIALLITFLTATGLPLITMIGLASFSTILTLILGANSYYDAWKKLTKSQTLTMDSLFTISTLTVLIVSTASFFVPWLPMMFEAGLLIYGFRHIGLAIEESLKEKIHPGQFKDRAPQTVRLALKSGMHEMPLNYIKAKDIIEIYPGEIIPLDGLCEQETSIYNTIISGKTDPQHYRQGAKVLAGMRLANDAKPLKILVLNNAQKSYLARLDEGIEQSMLEKAPLELKTQKLLSYFVPSVIAIAALSGIALSFFFPAAVAIQSAISVLVSACPCTLGLVIPLAVKTGVHKAADHGVSFKSTKALQEAEQIDTVIFDLNGTLTHGIPSVKNYELCAPKALSLEEFFSIAAALESSADHPIAKTIYTYSQTYNPKTLSITQLNKEHHSGVRAVINNDHYAIGGSALMHQLEVDISAQEKLKLEAGDSLVYLAKNKELLGYLVLTDPIRKDAHQTIKQLKAQGKEIYLCTGSDELTAQRYGQALGIATQNIHANCLATALDEQDQAKPKLIKLLQAKNKKVAMVGDAANDTHALAASNLGIAVLSQNSDELAQKHAGAVIQKDSLTPIANLFELSRQTVSNINQNLMMSIGYNLGALLISGGLLVTAGLTISPAIGAALMVLQACIILGNVYRFKQQPLSHLAEPQEALLMPSSFQQMQHCASMRPVNSNSSEMQCEETKQCTTSIFKPSIKPRIEEEEPLSCCLIK